MSEGDFVVQTLIVAIVRDIHFAIDISLDVYSALNNVAADIYSGRLKDFSSGRRWRLSVIGIFASACHESEESM